MYLKIYYDDFSMRYESVFPFVRRRQLLINLKVIFDRQHFIIRSTANIV